VEPEAPAKTWPANGAIGQTASFAGLAGGGLDTPITRHIAIRVSAGYQYSYFTLTHPGTIIPYSIPAYPPISAASLADWSGSFKRPLNERVRNSDQAFSYKG